MIPLIGESLDKNILTTVMLGLDRIIYFSSLLANYYTLPMGDALRFSFTE